MKLYLWSNHMANSLIFAISFSFKLNSNIKCSKIVKNTLYLKKVHAPLHKNVKKEIAVDIYFLLSNQSMRFKSASCSLAKC